jgi:hypothetical protein
MSSDHSKQDTQQEGAGQTHDAPSTSEQASGNNDMGLSQMIQEAEEKGVKGALLSRLKKTKIGKVSLDPSLGMSYSKTARGGMQLNNRRGRRPEWTPCA